MGIFTRENFRPSDIYELLLSGWVGDDDYLNVDVNYVSVKERSNYVYDYENP